MENDDDGFDVCCHRARIVSVLVAAGLIMPWLCPAQERGPVGNSDPQILTPNGNSGRSSLILRPSNPNSGPSCGRAPGLGGAGGRVGCVCVLGGGAWSCSWREA